MIHFASKVSTFSAISTRTFFMKYIVVCTTTIVHSSYNRYYETAKHFFLSKVRVEKRVFVKIKHLFSFGSLYKFPALGKTSWFMHELLSRKKLSYKNTTTKTFHKNNTWVNLKTKKGFCFRTCCKSKNMLKRHSHLFTLFTTFSSTCHKKMVKHGKLQF